MGCIWCHCATFLTVLSVCVPPKNSGLTDGFLEIFKERVGNVPLFRAGSSGSALVPWQDKILVLVPSSLIYDGTWVLCIICGQLDEFGEQFSWSFELGCHGQCSLHQCSNPGREFPSLCPVPLLHGAFVFRQRSVNLLHHKAESLPQKSDLGLLMPYNLWLHKHFCFCGLGSSSQSEYSWRRGGRGRKCEECCFKCVTLQPSCARRGFVTGFFWIKLCWVISFINLHKILMKKSLALKPRKISNFLLSSLELYSGAFQYLLCHFLKILFYDKEE